MSEKSEADAKWMARAGELAEIARAAGNVAVGSLVVLDGQVIAEASEQVPMGPRPLAHAEVLVAEMVMAEYDRDTLRQATMYTTAEPCVFCGFATREAGIGRVVMGRSSGEIGSVDGHFKLLESAVVARWGDPPELVRWQELDHDG